MPSSMLFGINNEGRVYSLYTNGTKWREFPYLGVEFKRLSSVPNFLWAIGGDRQIYVHVHGFDIPIRIREEVYENQTDTSGQTRTVLKIEHWKVFDFHLLPGNGKVLGQRI
uniref:Tectonin beta-propeller repeat-containing protein n=1 Tax=Cacopsylla melanoneura TaxID=428564 RepID=A0A8D8VTL8_9HEMI